MIQSIFKFLLNILASLVQVVVWPINQIIVNALPDLSEKIQQVSNGFNSLFSGLGWALGMLPSSVLVVLIFIVSVEIIKHSIYLSTHAILKIWTILQKIKFW